MTIETALIIGLVVAIAWLAYEYFQVYRQLTAKDKVRDSTIETSRKKAQKILDEALIEADKILKKAKTTASSHKEKLSLKMDAALNRVADHEINDFKKALEMETLSVEKAVGEKIAKRYDEVRQEIEDYKIKQMALYNEKVSKVLVQISKNLVGKVLNQNDHQKLVLEALGEAKQNGLFN